jgi:hypothetical protein
MSRLSRTLLATALLAFSTFARASTLRLVAPTNGATLRGGAFAELRWAAGELPAGAEEWEAFLSINGGKYYAFRVTPHLDIELRRFTFIVPNVDARDARILIRAGNEVRETHFEPRGSFSIVRDPQAERIVPRPVQFARGEAAREGELPVLAWAEGPRSGVGVTQQSSPAVPSPSLRSLVELRRESEVGLAPPVDEAAQAAVVETRRSVGDSEARRAAPLPLVVDLLLVCRRRNI